jgi:hypothetical protein
MSTQYPTYIQITRKTPVMLKKGMVIWAGNRDTQFLEVIDICHKPKSTKLYDGHNGTQCVNFVYQSELTSQDKHLRRERHNQNLAAEENIVRDYSYYEDKTVTIVNRKKRIKGYSG